MAVDWGTAVTAGNNGMTVGFDASWSSPAWNSSTATLTVNVWTRNKYNHDGDNQKLNFSGFDNNTVFSYVNDEPNASNSSLDVLRTTRTYTHTYGSSPANVTVGASVTETYWGGTPSISRTYTPPSRPAQPPEAPTMGTLSLTAGIRYIDLSWSASNNRATIDRYDIYRNGGYIATVYGEGSTTYRDNGPNNAGLGNGTTYNYTVYAHNSAGWSGPSNTPSATTASLPTAPGSLIANNSTFGQIGLTWTAANGNGYAVTYSVSRSPSGYSASTTGLSATDTTVAPYTDYLYTVTATTSVGSLSSSVSVKSMGGIGKVWNGTGYVTVLPKVWNGTSWIDAQARMWNGTEWKHGI